MTILNNLARSGIGSIHQSNALKNTVNLPNIAKANGVFRACSIGFSTVGDSLRRQFVFSNSKTLALNSARKELVPVQEPKFSVGDSTDGRFAAFIGISLVAIAASQVPVDLEYSEGSDALEGSLKGEEKTEEPQLESRELEPVKPALMQEAFSLYLSMGRKALFAYQDISKRLKAIDNAPLAYQIAYKKLKKEQDDFDKKKMEAVGAALFEYQTALQEFVVAEEKAMKRMEEIKKNSTSSYRDSAKDYICSEFKELDRASARLEKSLGNPLLEGVLEKSGQFFLTKKKVEQVKNESLSTIKANEARHVAVIAATLGSSIACVTAFVWGAAGCLRGR